MERTKFTVTLRNNGA